MNAKEAIDILEQSADINNVKVQAAIAFLRGFVLGAQDRNLSPEGHPIPVDV